MSAAGRSRRGWILVVGGAGYIGSHMVKQLDAAGYPVVTLDDFSTGFRDAVRYGELVEGDMGDRTLLDRLFSSRKFDAVMHFASFLDVAESVRDPAKYYDNNVNRTITLLDAMVEHSVEHFIFSSSASVYGELKYAPIDEIHPKAPVNPYGRSKLIIEQILGDYAHAYDLRSVSLRYFNAAGADPAGEIGERHEPETHLIPLILEAALGKRPYIVVYGDDYDTRDGSCVRDYIHVEDLCAAHLKAMDYLLAGGRTASFNLGIGQGFSVLEVIDTARRVTGQPIPHKLAARRPGDPASLVADAGRAREQLGWAPERADLEDIVRDAWHWASR